MTLKSAVVTLAESSAPGRAALRGWRRFKASLRSRARLEHEDRPWRLFNVELTNKCPFTCVMCSRTNNMTREQGLMSFETFKAVVDEYVAASPETARSEITWLHHFGESLVHPEFGKLVRYAVGKGVRAGMSINPLMLTPAVADDLLGSGIHTLNISLDGHDDESFKQIRGVPNAYEKSKANLLAFLKKKIETKNPVVVNFSMINFKMNRASIEKARAFWENVPGIDVFAAKEFTVWNGDSPDVNKLADFAVDNEKRRASGAKVSCAVPWEKLSVAWNGTVVPCCYDYDAKYPLGKVSDGLENVWNGERIKALRREFISGDVKNPLCARCPELYPPE